MLGIWKLRGLLPLTLGSVCGILFGSLLHFDDEILYLKNYGNGENSANRHAEHKAVDGVNLNIVMHSDENETLLEEDDAARKLRLEIRVLCAVLVKADFHGSFVPVIMSTWGKRCTKIIFISAEKSPGAPREILKLPDISDNDYDRWGKMRASLNFIYDTYIENYNWFLMTDHDEFVVLENLRSMLKNYSTSQPWAFGCRVWSDNKEVILTDSAIVLSNKALSLLATESLNDPKKCSQSKTGSYNIELSKCISNAKIPIADSRDEEERERFFPLNPDNLLMPNYLPADHWYRRTLFHPFKDGLECCSDKAISFHSLGVSELYLMEYMIYHLHPFGIDTLYDESLRKYIRDDPPVPEGQTQ